MTFHCSKDEPGWGLTCSQTRPGSPCSIYTAFPWLESSNLLFHQCLCKCCFSTWKVDSLAFFHSSVNDVPHPGKLVRCSGPFLWCRSLTNVTSSEHPSHLHLSHPRASPGFSFRGAGWVCLCVGKKDLRDNGSIREFNSTLTNDLCHSYLWKLVPQAHQFDSCFIHLTNVMLRVYHVLYPVGPASRSSTAHVFSGDTSSWHFVCLVHAPDLTLSTGHWHELISS